MHSSSSVPVAARAPYAACTVYAAGAAALLLTRGLPAEQLAGAAGITSPLLPEFELRLEELFA